MIFQLSDWFPKPMIWAIIVKFDQIRKNWWRISCAEILEVGKNFFAASSVKKMSRFEEVSPEKIKRIAWKFTKTVILLGLAGYEPTDSLVIYISSYRARPRRITVNYMANPVLANPCALIGSFSVRILQYGPFPWKPCIFVLEQSRQIQHLQPRQRKKSRS